MKEIKKHFNKNNLLKIFKIAVGSSIAILIADFLGLSYSASAGIITLLSIQDTKKETLFVAVRRFLAFILAIVTAFLLFESFGYTAITFGVFLFVFILFSYILHLQDGISMSAVLVTHFLIEQNMELKFIGNELFIFIIGTLIGILFNLYIPGNTQVVKEDMHLIEEQMKIILQKLADCIVTDGKLKEVKGCHNPACNGKCIYESDYLQLDKHLQKALAGAYANMNNTLLTDTRYYIEYFTMRRNQYTILEHMKDQMCRLSAVPNQAVPIALFMVRIGNQFHEYNNARKLLEELDIIQQNFKEEPNPESREEFENRAILYLLLYDLEEFLNIKKEFVENISQKQIEIFWTE